MADLCEGRAALRPQHVDHQGVAGRVQTTEEEAGDPDNWKQEHDDFRRQEALCKLTEQQNVEVVHVRHEVDKQTADADQRRQEHQLLPLLSDPGLNKAHNTNHHNDPDHPHLEHGPHAQGGQAAAPRQHSPDEVDLLASHPHHVGQVGLTGAEDTHHQTLSNKWRHGVT